MEEKATVISVAPRAWMFQLEDGGKVWSLPLMGSLPISTARKLAKMADVNTEADMIDAAYDIFEAICPGLMDAVTTDQLAAILNGWREASGIAPGESPASSD